MVSLQSLEKTFFKIDDVVALHYFLMNIVMLIREKYEDEGYYCYCKNIEIAVVFLW